MQVVADAQETEVAALLPKATVVAPGAKLVPAIVTGVPPASGPKEGETEVMVGRDVVGGFTAIW